LGALGSEGMACACMAGDTESSNNVSTVATAVSGGVGMVLEMDMRPLFPFFN